MADGSLKLVVQAVIDEFLANIDRVAQETREVAGSVQESLLGMNEASKTATSEMVTSANQVADGTAAAWRRVAEASNEYKLAQREVRNASRDTTALAAGEEAAINRLAIAKERLAAASTELTAAQKATIVVNEEEAASFDLLGGALGRLIEGALILEYVNHLKESTLQMSHLSEATGIGVKEITELEAAMKAQGVSTENLPQQLTKLSKSMLSASDGSKELQRDFRSLGIETDDWKGKLPPTLDILLQMGHHLQEVKGNTTDLAIASKILGKSIYETSAFLMQGDDAIRREMGAFASLGEAVEANVTSARQLQAVETALSTTLQTNLLPVFGFLVKGIVSVAAAVDLMEGSFDVAKEYLKSWVTAVSHGLADFRKAIDDLVNGGGIDRFSKLVSKAMDDMSNEIVIGANKVDKIWQDAFDKANAHFAVFNDALGRKDEESLAKLEKTSKKKQKTAEEWIAIDNQLLQKELDQHLKTQSKISESELAIIIRENDEKIKANNKVLADSMENANAMLDDARAAAQGKLEIEKSELDFEVALGKISNAQKYQQLQKYEADAYAAERQALLLKQGLYEQDEKEFARIGRQIQKLDDDFTKHQIDNARKETLAKLQSFQQFFRQIDQNVKMSLAGWLQGTQSFSQAIGKLWQDIGLSIAEQIEQIGLNWLNKHIFMRAISAIFHIDQEAEDAAAAAKKITQDGITSRAVILFDSDIAAANAYAAYAEWPPLAAAMAAQAKATVLSFAAFEQGGIVPSDQMAYVHKNEMVLPAAISQRLQTMTGAQSPAGGNSGHVININYSVHAVDASSFADTMHRHADILGNVIMRRLRKKGFAMA